MLEPGLGNEWDLGQILTERVQPTESVAVYLNEAASYAKDKLVKQHAATKDPEALKELDAALTEVEEALGATKYTFHLTGVPSRMRDDIYSKSMVEVPVTPINVLGMDDPSNENKRKRVRNILTWVAQIECIEDPTGKKNYDLTRESIEPVYDGLPSTAREKINKAIADLTTASERFTVESQDPDF